MVDVGHGEVERDQDDRAVRRPFPTMVSRVFRDERAAEVTELAIVLALVVAGSVATIILIGPKVEQFYSALNTVIP